MRFSRFSLEIEKSLEKKFRKAEFFKITFQNHIFKITFS